MPHEVDEALGRQPDLVIVPVGVGSLAEAVVGHHRRAAAARGGAGGRARHGAVRAGQPQAGDGAGPDRGHVMAG